MIRVIFLLCLSILAFHGCKNDTSGDSPVLLHYSHGECREQQDLSLQSKTDSLAKDEELVEIRVDGLTLYITHKDAMYNCCLDDILCTIESNYSDKRIRIWEEEINPACYCICKYDVNTVVQVSRGGTYLLEIWNRNNETMLWRGQVTVKE